MKRATCTVHLPAGAMIVGDDLYAEDHPHVRAYPQYFEDAETGEVVERATARPGEKRTTKPR